MPTWSRVAPSIYRHGPTGALYERSVIDGRPTFRKLASYRVTDAKAELIELRAKRQRIERGLDKAPDDKGDWALSKVLNSYLAAGCPDRSMHRRPARTEGEEKRRVTKLLEFFRTERVRDLGVSLCSAYGAWRLKNTRTGNDGRRSADMELVTLANALDHLSISTAPIEGRKTFWKPSTARHCRDCAPRSGDELHGIAQILFSGNVRSHPLGWQALFEGFTGCRTSEVLAWRMDAKGHSAGAVESNRWLWLHRAKSGVNPWVALDGRPELVMLLKAHNEWHASHYPQSPWYFPSPEDPTRPVAKWALNGRLDELHKSGSVERKITSHGLRAFYVLVRRSDGIADGQIAAEIGDRTTGLIESTYGSLPPKWQGGPEVGFMPKGQPAWEFIKAPSRRLKHIIRSVIQSGSVSGAAVCGSESEESPIKSGRKAA